MQTADGSPLSWRLPHGRPYLPDDEVHVWRGLLDQPQPRLELLFLTLTPDEKERAARFYFSKDRDHFIAARGLLRSILGDYLSLEPGRLRFFYNRYGKPRLSEDAGRGLRFNLSHSHGLALLAIARRRELGVDVERIRPEVAGEEIAERFFSPREVAMLRSLPADLQPEAFFNCWTRKEAYIKARGKGLSLPLDEFDVSLAPGEPAAILEDRSRPPQLSSWSMVELAPQGEYKAALVVEGNRWRLRCWQWPG